MSNIENSIKDEYWENATARGKRLYDRYCSWVDYKSFDGDELGSFESLPDKIKQAWIMASLNKSKPLPKEKTTKQPK